MGRGLVIAAAIFCALVGAQTASAGTLARAGSTVVYTEADSDLSANDVDIVQSGPNYYIGDRNEAISDLGSGCTLVVEWLWFCGQTGNASNPPPTAYDIKLGGGNDRLLPNQYGAAFGCCTPPDIPVTVNGGPGNDSITGALANDVLAGGFGSDVIAGSTGTDKVSYAGRTDGVTVALGSTGANAGSANDGAPGARDTVSEFDVEGVIGSEGADNLSGNKPVPFTLDGRGGPDVITGGDAASVLLEETATTTSPAGQATRPSRAAITTMSSTAGSAATRSTGRPAATWRPTRAGARVWRSTSGTAGPTTARPTTVPRGPGTRFRASKA